ncbi:hypothetical protein GCM10011505_00060 [Tistrella bauzanensis]|uniref:DUF6314 domain-containing protein n=1 Tax=Tistrella bauzanensis TaxID=657419 RepID=A0ABQ1I8E3_9PROT|nr:DUF6314 family protein [Tistrella bauzanensis]GGB22854.1 hypothetical protein GCM10011505_00060 [Tistrella bauzanensis]
MTAGTDIVDPCHHGRFNALAGRWQISRAITGGSVGQMTGIAIVTAGGPDRLDYAESGQLALPGGPVLDVFRRYTYRLLADGRIAIDFADGPTSGARFVTLAFVAGAEGAGDGVEGGWSAADLHHCGDDLYHATMTLNLPDRFSTDIQVTGPRKDYRALTRYRRIAGSS